MKISEALYKAAGHIEEYGWYQGYFWPDHEVGWEPPYVWGDSCCVLGAIAVVEEVDPINQDTEAMKFLADHLGLKGVVSGSARVADWNDMSMRTKDEVLTALRGAAQRAERLGR